MMIYIICHYGEIGLKGKNRGFFEKKLVENIKTTLNKDFFNEVKRISGRLLIKLTAKGEEEREEIEKTLKKVFGLVYFAFAEREEQKIKSIEKRAADLIREKNFETFRVSTQRSKKDFFLTSPEINEKVGGGLKKELNKRVDLENPDLTVFIEIVEKYAFLYLEKISGPGGLPVGVSGRALCLISGGLDSPVAAWQMMKRGLKIVFIHFYAYVGDENKALEKIEKIASTLNQYQAKSRLYLIPFKRIQERILKDNRYCCLCCKRLMFKIAEKIAQEENCQALVTGDNLGQVASQTIENISVIGKAVNLPVLRPLIGFDKQEIIEIAEEIGTYDLSCLPTEFYCQKLLPRHPATKANLEKVEIIEKGLKIEKISIESTEIKRVELR